MLIDATLQRIVFRFITRRGQEIDSYAIERNDAVELTPPARTRPWRAADALVTHTAVALAREVFQANAVPMLS